MAVYSADQFGNPRKVQKIYTPDGMAYKGYKEVGGVARPFWNIETSSGGVEYYGEIEPLEYGRYFGAGGRIGDYAVFFDGEVYDGLEYFEQRTVNLYDSNLVEHDMIFSDKASTKNSVVITNINYGIVGGSSFTGYSFSPQPSAFDNNLIELDFESNLDPSATLVLSGASAVNITYLSAAGAVSDVFGELVFDENLNFIEEIGTLYAGGMTFGNYALFSASTASFGVGFFTPEVVDAYDSNLNHFSLTPATIYEEDGVAVLGAASNNYAVFAYGSFYINTMNVYDHNLTQLPPIEFPFDVYLGTDTDYDNSMMTGNGDYILVEGATFDDEGELIDMSMYCIDENLVITKICLIDKLFSMGAVADKYVLSGGGYESVDYSLNLVTTVDVYEIV